MMSDGWEPIGTAPKGKWIYLKGGEPDTNIEDMGPVAVGFGDKYTNKDGWYIGSFDGYDLRYCWPTHWKEID